jgi:hypothetical protein
VWLWISKLVIGLDLCPFALDSLSGLRVVVANSTNRDETLDVFTDEMNLISNSVKDQPATTVVVFPMALFDQPWRSGNESSFSPDLRDEDDGWDSFTW